MNHFPFSQLFCSPILWFFYLKNKFLFCARHRCIPVFVPVRKLSLNRFIGSLIGVNSWELSDDDSCKVTPVVHQQLRFESTSATSFTSNMSHITGLCGFFLSRLVGLQHVLLLLLHSSLCHQKYLFLLLVFPQPTLPATSQVTVSVCKTHSLDFSQPTASFTYHDRTPLARELYEDPIQGERN
jgi:hypothetical protein